MYYVNSEDGFFSFVMAPGRAWSDNGDGGLKRAITHVSTFRTRRFLLKTVLLRVHYAYVGRVDVINKKKKKKNTRRFRRFCVVNALCVFTHAPVVQIKTGLRDA